MLPPELLRQIFSFIEDVECFDTAGFQPPSHRYQGESAQGRRNVPTKSALLLVSRQWYQFAIELAWSWISIRSDERLLWMDTVIRGDVVPASIKTFESHRHPRHSAEEKQDGNKPPLPFLWIRRLDVESKIPGNYDQSPLPPALARILRACSNLRVFVSDFSVGGMDCQRTSPLVLDALKSLRNLTRLDFGGYESPSLEDYIDLIPHLGKLEQWVTGRIAPPWLGDDEIVECLKQRGLLSQDFGELQEESRTTAFSLPNLVSLQVSHQPLYSSLRLLAHTDLPSLTHVSFRHLDFYASRIDALFSALGHQFTHLSTHDIRTSAEPFGHAQVLSICPNLQDLTFSPRLRDDRHQQDWRHPRLQTIGLRSVLPKTIPKEAQLANNIGLSLQAFLEWVLNARVTGSLPSLLTIRIEDTSAAALVFERKYGKHWDELCQGAGVRLEDGEGRRIPSELPSEFEEGVALKVVEDRDPEKLSRKRKKSRVLKRIFNHVAGKVWKRSN